MYGFIDYTGEKRPNWSDDQFYWMAVCEHIAAHWYFFRNGFELSTGDQI